MNKLVRFDEVPVGHAFVIGECTYYKIKPCRWDGVEANCYYQNAWGEQRPAHMAPGNIVELEVD